MVDVQDKDINVMVVDITGEIKTIMNRMHLEKLFLKLNIVASRDL